MNANAHLKNCRALNILLPLTLTNWLKLLNGKCTLGNVE